MKTRRANRSAQRISLKEIEEYEAQRIVGRRCYFGRNYYLVKWKGYTQEENTWEPIEHLEGIINQVLIFDYKLKKEFMTDRKKWEIKKIEDRLKEVQKDQNEMNRQIEMNALQQQLEVVHRQLNQLHETFEIEENQAKYPKKHLKVENFSMVQQKEESKQFNRVQAQQWFVEVDHGGRVSALLSNLQQQPVQEPASLTYQAILVLQKGRARKRAQDNSYQPLSYDSLDQNPYFHELNGNDLTVARKYCQNYIMSLFGGKKYVAGKINCNSPLFNEFTPQYILMKQQKEKKNIVIKVIDFVEKKISGSFKIDDTVWKADLQLLLVYFPAELLSFLEEISD